MPNDLDGAMDAYEERQRQAELERQQQKHATEEFSCQFDEWATGLVPKIVTLSQRLEERGHSATVDAPVNTADGRIHHVAFIFVATGGGGGYRLEIQSAPTNQTAGVTENRNGAQNHENKKLPELSGETVLEQITAGVVDTLEGSQ